MIQTRSEGPAIVLFDGVCTLCNGAVTFIIDHDPDAYFAFAPLQSEAGAALLGPGLRELSSLILFEDGQKYTHSTAALRVARKLRGVWPLYALIAVPRPLRDLVYTWVAANRYRWFGKLGACRLPTPELKRRFL